MYRTTLLLQKLVPTILPWNITALFLQRRRRPQLRGDTIIAITIPLACIGILIEAYYRTDYNDADTSLEAQFRPSNDCIDYYNNNNNNRSNHCTSTTTSASSSNSTVSAETTSLSDSKTTTSTRNRNSIVETLERDGIVVIPNVISATMLSAVRDNIQSLQQQPPNSTLIRSDDSPNERNGTLQRPHYVFAMSGNDTDVRQDKIIWLRNDSNTGNPSHTSSSSSSSKTLYPGRTDMDDSDLALVEETCVSTKCSIGHDLEYCINLIRGIPYALEKNGYTLSNDHRIPKQCQLSMYRGDNISSYQRHLDTCISTIYDLGLLEYLRLSDYRQRRITVILYLNEAHRPIHHGGTLRCWVAKELSNDGHPSPQSSSQKSSRDNNNNNDAVTGKTIFYPSLDIQPTGGTLVIFQSQR